MKVDVFSSGGSLPTLNNSLRFYTFTVDYGSYTNISDQFYYDPATVAQGQAHNLKVFYLGTNGWNEVGGTVYADAQYVVVNLAHFSTYAVAIIPQNNTGPGPLLTPSNTCSSRFLSAWQ